MALVIIMIYLDYSATTKTSEEVLDTFLRVSRDFVGNPNSLHKLGILAKQLEESSTRQIASLLGVSEDEIIYTSGSSESNNLAIKGICLKYQSRGKHILTTHLEHSSIYGPLGYLQRLGFEVEFLKTKDGIVDLDDLRSKLRDDTILVSIASVSSETGLLQPIDEIGKILKEYPKLFFHVDATQSIGKVNVSFQNVDLVSISAHKIYGIKGVGLLIKKKNIELEPIIHGGKSTTKYRSGTPALPLIASFARALRLALEDVDKKYEKVLELNRYLKESILDIPNVVINSNEHCIPHILNLSVLTVKPETMLHAFEEYDIYISTKSACSSSDSISKSVLELTKDEKRASSSIRVSISYLTLKEEIDAFIVALKEITERFGNIR
jgi:cysteine desulfurase